MRQIVLVENCPEFSHGAISIAKEKKRRFRFLTFFHICRHCHIRYAIQADQDGNVCCLFSKQSAKALGRNYIAGSFPTALTSGSLRTRQGLSVALSTFSNFLPLNNS